MKTTIYTLESPADHNGRREGINVPPVYDAPQSCIRNKSRPWLHHPLQPFPSYSERSANQILSGPPTAPLPTSMVCGLLSPELLQRVISCMLSCTVGVQSSIKCSADLETLRGESNAVPRSDMSEARLRPCAALYVYWVFSSGWTKDNSFSVLCVKL